MRELSSLVRYMGALGLLCFLGCTPKEFVMKQPPSRPVAKDYPEDSSVFLMRKTHVRISDDGLSYSENTHNQIKILSEKGLRKGWRAVVLYNETHEKITNFKSRIIRPGGKWISRSWRVKDSSSSALFSNQYFSDYRYKSVLLSFPVPGSVIEYRYSRTGNSWMMAPHFMQLRLPTMKAIYSISAPSKLKVRSKIFPGINFESSKVKYSKQTDPEDPSRTLHTWRAMNVPAIHVYRRHMESLRPPWPTQASRVQVVFERYRLGKHKGEGRTWVDIAKFYRTLVGNRDASTPYISQVAKEVTKGAKTKEDKIRKIYDFVRKKIRYVMVGIGLGGWQPQSADFTLKQRYGDCKAKATLLKAMLDSVGVKSYHVLVRTRHLGQMSSDFPADYSVFNHVVNYLPNYRGGRYLDATSSGTAFGFLPSLVLGASALIINGDKSQPTTIQQASAESNVLHSRLELTRQKKQIDFVWITRRTGSYRLKLDEKITQKKLNSETAKKNWANWQLGLLARRMAPWVRLGVDVQKKKLTSVSIAEKSGALESRIAFTIPTHKTKKRIIFLPMLWAHTADASTGLLAKRKYFSVLQGLGVTKHINEVVFKKWQPLECPPSVSLKDKYFQYQLSCQKKDQSLYYRRDLMFPRADIELTDHENFCRAYDKVRESDRRIVILRKGYGDKDKDGVKDNVDECPKTPGLKKYKGCPDRDGDTIIDKNDACPDVKGVADSDKTKNGCPKIVLVKVTKTEIKILQKIFFRTGSSHIKHKSYGVLDQVAEVLGSRKDIRVRIEGHTDNRGGKRSNLRLSKRRAASVRKYLIKKGVAEDRLESEGFGMSKPLVPNNNWRNRAKNRRVQFKVIKKADTAKKK